MVVSTDIASRESQTSRVQLAIQTSDKVVGTTEAGRAVLVMPAHLLAVNCMRASYHCIAPSAEEVKLLGPTPVLCI